MADKKLLAIRKEMRNKKPKFIREGARKTIKLKRDTSWRRPKGRHSKLRHQFAGNPKKVKPGFKTNKAVRGLHSSGLIPVIVRKLTDALILDKSLHGAIIGSTVGMRNKVKLLEALKKQGVKVLNLKEDYTVKAQAKLKERQAVKDKIATRKLEKDKKKKKDVKKEDKKEVSDEEKAEEEKKEKDKVLTKAEK